MNNFFELNNVFPDDDSCFEFLEKHIWKNVPTCPKCSSTKKIYSLKNYQYKCGHCKKQFRVTHNTIFYNSKIPLKKWFFALYLFSSHKKGISSCQLAKDIGVTQKSSWLMLHKLREMMSDKVIEKLKNTIEIDETYIGGKEKHKHKGKKTKSNQGRSLKTKTAILGILEREGKLILQQVDSVDEKTLLPILNDNIHADATVVTDEWRSYRNIPFKHEVVNHSAKEYVRDESYLSNLENFWAHLKRGINGIYHWVSSKHVSAYCSEFAFRYNTRKMGEQERFHKCLNTLYKRITYQQLIRIKDKDEATLQGQT